MKRHTPRPAQESAKRSPWMWAPVATAVFAAAAMGALLLRWTVRDAVWPLSAVFYATPCWVIASFAVAAFVSARLARMPRSAEAAAVASVLLLSWSVGKDVRPFAEAAGGPSDIRLAHWNPFNGIRGKEEMAAVLRDLDADVICLVEGGGQGKFWRKFWAEQLPDYNAGYFRFGYVILSRHPLRLIDPPSERPQSGRVEAVVTIGGRDVRFLMFHPDSNPLYDRTPVMRPLSRRAEELASQPTVIVGDFNLPSDSHHFDAIRDTFTLASDEGGAFWRPTWPVPLPVLTLDQAWVSPRLEVAACRHVWSARSDHRPIVVELRFADDGSDAREERGGSDDDK